MSKKEEPIVIINGKALTEPQAMTVRAAIENFDADLKKNGLGDDAHGVEMTKLYRDRISEIRSLIFI
ncbi:MAG: hypothetical protein CBB95_07615 [Alteromonas sp. TMED35]|uniref:hypothetical protein n=1 Tax=uncultured Alteromonas sp. TaxID=179113 RepID=UPI000B68E205|nr:MAG: hypothetical protein CBB95_07615 [Alteromonas sp. TMED35]